MARIRCLAFFLFLLLSTTHPDVVSGKGIKLKKGSKSGGSARRPIKLKKKGQSGSASASQKSKPIHNGPTQSQVEQMAAMPDAPPLGSPPTPPPPPPETDEAKIHITAPPDESTVAGSSFDVSIQISPVNPDFFTSTYNTTDSRICISLDGSSYNCWPVFGGKIRYINAVDGPHSLHAVLMRKGELVASTITESVQFTTVEDPEIGSEDEDKEDEGEEDEIDLDKEEEKKVQIDMPMLSLTVPPEKVTLPGTSVQFVSNVVTGDMGTFKEYFKYQFTCYNVDLSTAHACWSIFDENVVPYITHLEPGLHTVEGVITHPETRKAIEETAFETRTFFTSGEKNEAAAVVVEVDVDEQTYSIPVAAGGDATNQGIYFCGARGILNEECPGFVAQKIMNAANQF